MPNRWKLLAVMTLLASTVSHLPPADTLCFTQSSSSAISLSTDASVGHAVPPATENANIESWTAKTGTSGLRQRRCRKNDRDDMFTALSPYQEWNSTTESCSLPD